jgi:hypothetical protein
VLQLLSRGGGKMDMRGFDANSISDAVEVYGAAPGGVACLRGEDVAAQESIENGLYITWIPQSLDLIREEANRSRYEGNDQCCRVGPSSMCLCGHKLADHKEINKKSSFIRPPKCGKSGCRCFGYSYMPSRPEECGQWWLPRRRDFDLKAWRKRVQAHPEEYACIGCDLKITDHETLFETRQQRVRRGTSLSLSPLH